MFVRLRSNKPFVALTLRSNKPFVATYVKKKKTSLTILMNRNYEVKCRLTSKETIYAIMTMLNEAEKRKEGAINDRCNYWRCGWKPF